MNEVWKVEKKYWNKENYAILCEYSYTVLVL